MIPQDNLISIDDTVFKIINNVYGLCEKGKRLFIPKDGSTKEYKENVIMAICPTNIINFRA